MSSVVGVIKEAGPYVVALAGMAAGYFGGRSTGRESRHHARVEALYQEMLEEMFQRRKAGLALMRIEAIGEEPYTEPPRRAVSVARISLYASRAVQDAWDEVDDLLLRMELGGSEDPEVQTELILSYGDLGRALQRAMRKDLGVPPSRPVARLRAWLSDRRRYGQTRRFNEKLARQRAQKKAVGGDVH